MSSSDLLLEFRRTCLKQSLFSLPCAGVFGMVILMLVVVSICILNSVFALLNDIDIPMLLCKGHVGKMALNFVFLFFFHLYYLCKWPESLASRASPPPEGLFPPPGPFRFPLFLPLLFQRMEQNTDAHYRPEAPPSLSLLVFLLPLPHARRARR